MMNADERDESRKVDDSKPEDEKPDGSEPGTRAGGPVITKGPSQKQPESSR